MIFALVRVAPAAASRCADTKMKVVKRKTFSDLQLLENECVDE